MSFFKKCVCFIGSSKGVLFISGLIEFSIGLISLILNGFQIAMFIMYLIGCFIMGLSIYLYRQGNQEFDNINPFFQYFAIKQTNKHEFSLWTRFRIKLRNFCHKLNAVDRFYNHDLYDRNVVRIIGDFLKPKKENLYFQLDVE